MIWQHLTGFIYRYRIIISVIFITLAGIATYTALKIRVEHNALTIFTSNDPELQYLEDFQSVFGQDINFTFILLSPKQDDIFTPKILGQIRHLTEQLTKIAGITNVISITNAQRLMATAAALETLPVLADPITEQAAQDAKTRIIASSLLREKLLTQDQKSTLLILRLDPSFFDNTKLATLLAEIRTTLATQLSPTIDAALVGVPVVQQGYVERISQDQQRFLPIVACLLLVLLFILFRQPIAVAIPMLVVLLSVAITVATMVLVKQPFNIINFTIPTLILVVGIAYSIHFIERYLESLRQGRSTTESIFDSMQAIGNACLLTTLTTVVGFVSLITADIYIIQNFGLWAGFGIFVTYLITLTLLPLLLFFFPIKNVAYKQVNLQAIDRFLNRTSALSVTHSKKTILIWGVLFIGFAYASTFVQRQFSLLEELFPNDQLVIDQRKVEHAGFGVLPLEVDLQGSPEVFKDPTVLAKVAALQTWLETEPMVAKSSSLLDLVGELHLAFTGEEKLYDDKDALAQALLLFETSGIAGLEEWVTPDYSRLRLQVLRYDYGSKSFDALYAATKAKAQELFLASNVAVHITGSSVIANRAANSIVNDLVSSLGTSFAVIAILLMLLFRSVRVGLLSMIPNTLPLATGSAVMGLMGINLRISSSIIFSIALGIAVDDTIHLIERYRKEMKQQNNVEQAIARTISTTGRAVLWTSTLFTFGFMALTLGHFRGVSDFGLLTAIILLIGVTADLTLTPALLKLTKPFRKK